MNLVVVARRPEIGERAAATIQRLDRPAPVADADLSPADPDGPSLARRPDPGALRPAASRRAGDVRRDHLPHRRRRRRPPPRRARRAAADPRPAGHGLVAGRAAVRRRPGPASSSTMADRLVVDGSSLVAATGSSACAQLAAAAAMDRSCRSATSRSSASRAGGRRSPRPSTCPSSCRSSRSIRRIAVTYGTHDETGVAAGDERRQADLPRRLARLAARHAVVKPLAPVTGGPGRRPARGQARGGRGPGSPLHRGLGGDAARRRGRRGRRRAADRLADAAGTTLRVEILAERRGSELRADVTAEAETVHVRGWQDGVEALDRGVPGRPPDRRRTCSPRRSRPGGPDRIARDGDRAWPRELAGGDRAASANRTSRSCRTRRPVARVAAERIAVGPDGRRGAPRPGRLGDDRRVDAGRRSTASWRPRRCASPCPGRRSTSGSGTTATSRATIRSPTCSSWTRGSSRALRSPDSPARVLPVSMSSTVATRASCCRSNRSIRSRAAWRSARRAARRGARPHTPRSSAGRCASTAPAGPCSTSSSSGSGRTATSCRSSRAARPSTSSELALAIPAPTHVEPHVERVTLNPSILGSADELLAITHGAAKAAAIGEIFGPVRDPGRWPAQLARRSGAIWLIDEAAAAQLPANAVRA